MSDKKLPITDAELFDMALSGSEFDEDEVPEAELIEDLKDED